MILSDVDIRRYIEAGTLKIEPIFDDTIRENGVDLRLGRCIARLKNLNKVFDYKVDDPSEYYILEKGDSFILHPNEHILIHTLEYIKMPRDLIAFINLRSSYARLGLTIPPTIVDACFEGNLTIGLQGGAYPVKLYKGDRIIHLIFAKLTNPVEKPYSGKYLGQKGIQIPIFRQ